MTIFRAIPLSVHGAIDVALGPALIAAPFAFGFGPAALVFSITLGGLMLAIALATHATEERTVPISTHIALDYGLAAGLLLAGIAFGLAGDTAALVVFGLAGFALLGVSANTIYSARP